MEKKKVTMGLIVMLCLPQFAVGLFTTMINNYLIYFYQPTQKSGIPVLITQGNIFLGILTVIGLIKALGHVIDAVSDPLVASLSDKSKNKRGRRIPYMQMYAIPFAVSALLIFWSPSQNLMFNNIWLAIWIWAYFVFYTLYMIPHGALLPEMVTDEKMLVDTYTFHSLFFVVGSMLGYATPAIVSGMKSALGLEPIMAWRYTFLVFAIIGVILLLIPALAIKEKDYVSSVRPTVSLGKSLKHAFKNKHFVLVTLGQLFEGTGMGFFQACIMYYITELMGIPESKSIIIMATSIVGSLCLYPLINKWSKTKGKKMPMIVGCITFTVAEFLICSVDVFPKGHELLVAILFALFVSLPFAVLNILPSSMMADVIQYDTIKTGINQEGTFSAAKSFVTKLGISLAMMIVPSLVNIGASGDNHVGKQGLLLSAIVGGLFTLVSVVIYAFYNEKEVLGTIRAHAKKEKSE